VLSTLRVLGSRSPGSTRDRALFTELTPAGHTLLAFYLRSIVRRYRTLQFFCAQSFYERAISFTALTVVRAWVRALSARTALRGAWLGVSLVLVEARSASHSKVMYNNEVPARCTYLVTVRFTVEIRKTKSVGFFTSAVWC